MLLGGILKRFNSSVAPNSLAIVDVSSDGTQAGHPTSA